MKIVTTKRALLMSALSLLLCVSMLVGTTFAWFTDSVTSGKNTIQSGNLDVELYYSPTLIGADDAGWKKVDGATDVFGTNNLWEPGYTKVAYFKVVNAGSLALKYTLTADVYSETAGTNKAGASFLLSDYLYTKVLDAAATREDILASTGNQLKGTINIDNAGTLLKGATDIVGLAIWMPTTVGNEANHNGNAPKIEFGINLLATQAMKEEDSFGDDYDKDATYPVANAAELADALVGGKNVTLAADIALDANTTININSNVESTLDLNGHTLTATNSNTATHNFAIDVKGGTLNVSNGTIEMNHTGANMGWNGATTVIDVTAGGVLNLDGVTVKNEGGTDMNFAVHLNNWGDATLNANNCVFEAPYCSVRVFNSGPQMNNVKITNSTLTGNKMAFWVHNYVSSDFGGKVYSGASAAYDQAAVDARLNLDIYNNNTFVVADATAYPSPIRYGFNDSVYYDVNGNLIP